MNSISPKYFQLSTDQDIINVINRANSKRGLNTSTVREQQAFAAAIFTGRQRGLRAAFTANPGFNWSTVYEGMVSSYRPLF